MLGEVIRRYRQARGWDQRALAKATGYPQSYISNLEREKRRGTVEAIQRIADALGAPIAELLEAAKKDTPPALIQLEREGANSAMLEDLLRIWDTLTPEDQHTAVELARTLSERAKKRTQTPNGQTHPASG